MACFPCEPTLITTERRTVPPFMSETVSMAVTCCAVVKVRVNTGVFVPITSPPNDQL